MPAFGPQDSNCFSHVARMALPAARQLVDSYCDAFAVMSTHLQIDKKVAYPNLFLFRDQILFPVPYRNPMSPSLLVLGLPLV